MQAPNPSTERIDSGHALRCPLISNVGHQYFIQESRHCFRTSS